MAEIKQSSKFNQFNSEDEITAFSKKIVNRVIDDVESLKRFMLDQALMIFLSENNEIDVNNSNFRLLLETSLNAKPVEGRDVKSLPAILENMKKQALQQNINDEYIKEAQNEIKNDFNNFKNTLLSNKDLTLLIAKRKIETSTPPALVRMKNNNEPEFVSLDRKLGRRISAYLDTQSAQSSVKIDGSQLSQIVQQHLTHLVSAKHREELSNKEISLSEEDTKDMASFISSVCKVFDKKNDIAKAFYKSPKEGVNKVRNLCTNKEHIPEILAHLFSNTLDQNNRLDLEHVGLYLSDPEQESRQTLEHFVALQNFRSKDFVDSLRSYLQSFKLPGEAQKIDRIIEAFGSEYSNQNPHSKIGDRDSAYILAFATIMLSTDLHKNHSNAKKMTADQFKKNLRGLNGGQDFSSALLDEIYQSIKNNQLRCEFINEPPGYEINTNKLTVDKIYNKLNDYLNGQDISVKEIFPNLQNLDQWQITKDKPKSWLNKFIGYKGNIELSNKMKDNEKVIIQVYKPNIFSQWFLSKGPKVIIQPSRGAIAIGALAAAVIGPEVTSVKGIYGYEKEELESEYRKARSEQSSISVNRLFKHKVSPAIQNIVTNNPSIIKSLSNNLALINKDNTNNKRIKKGSNIKGTSYNNFDIS